MEKEEGLMEKIVSLAKRRGFIFPGSEIYGGLAGTYDYGPLGLALKNNIKNVWWKMAVLDREDVYGVDAAILMNPKAWEASGHVSGFSDPLVECRACKNRFRTDHLIKKSKDLEKYLKKIQDQFVSFWADQDIGELEGMYENIARSRFQEHLEKVGYSKRDSDLLVGFFLNSFDSLVTGQDVDIDVDHRTGQIVGAGSSLHGDLRNFISTEKNFVSIATALYLDNEVKCPICGKYDWSPTRQFNMMFKTHAGSIEDASSVVYLRPETAGGIFVNFKNVIDSFHPKLPFGIAQIGKAFRNEIAPRDFVFRSREFEQMEVEYFVHPDAWESAFQEWQGVMTRFAKACGLTMSSFYPTDIADEDLAHYSKKTVDFEFDFPFGRGELWGLAYRTNFDLLAHEKGSGTTLNYTDETGAKITPHVIEPSLGVDRTVLAVLASAYKEDTSGEDVRVYLAFPPHMAPIKAAVFPLLKNKPELVAKAREVFMALKKEVPQVVFDDNGNIGKRYRRQDEIGTPWCITIDFDTLGENPENKDTVTVRNRDTGEQERMLITEALKRVVSSSSFAGGVL